MSTSSPMNSRVNQLENIIKQSNNNPRNSLDSRNGRQNQAIESIEEENNQLKEKFEASDAWAHDLERQVKELSAQNLQLNQLVSNNTNTYNPTAPNFNISYIPRSTEENMLIQIHENARFMQQLVLRQERTIKNQNVKINTLHRSFSWQITAPIRASGIIANQVGAVAKIAVTPIIKAQKYVNQRPKLKNNLMQLTGLQKLYKKKAEDKA